MNKGADVHAVIWHITANKIKEKHDSGVYREFIMAIKPNESDDTDHTPTGKHGWTRINNQVHLQQVPHFEDGGSCGHCEHDSDICMGIPVNISRVGEGYDVEMFVPPNSRPYCSFECTLSALLELQDPDFICEEAKRNLATLYDVMHPGELDLRPRQPNGLPLSEEIQFSPHLLRFHASMPLVRVHQVGHAFHSS